MDIYLDELQQRIQSAKSSLPHRDTIGNIQYSRANYQLITIVYRTLRDIQQLFG